MYVEPAPDRAEALAARVAATVRSWRFVGALLLSIIVWLVVNAVWQPFEPYPLDDDHRTRAGLATVAALQGPPHPAGAGAGRTTRLSSASSSSRFSSPTRWVADSRIEG